MKRYAIFAGSNYYPEGGLNDFRSDHADRDEAVRVASELLNPTGRAKSYHDPDWCHVADLKTRRIVWENGRDQPESGA